MGIKTQIEMMKMILARLPRGWSEEMTEVVACDPSDDLLVFTVKDYENNLLAYYAAEESPLGGVYVKQLGELAAKNFIAEGRR